MITKLRDIITSYDALQELLMDPEVSADRQKMIELSKKSAKMQTIYDIAKKYVLAWEQREEARGLLTTEKDSEMLDLAQMQFDDTKHILDILEEEAKIALLPKDDNDDKNIYFELRPAAGGDESGLFASELLRAYLLYAQQKGRRTEVVEEQLSDIGGVKFVMVKISGDNVYAHLKRESGVHRVQRIPQTESQGRVHTSTVTIAIMPEVDDVVLHIDPNDVEMDTFAASSAGGQNANKNQTGVRLRHIPSGTIVTISDSKSQMHNKDKARNVLKAKLYQVEQDKQTAESREVRGNQIGGGDRSEKIRTYNFPQDRVTDHRVKKSRSNIPAIMNGDMDDIMQDLAIENQAMLLSAVASKI